MAYPPLPPRRLALLALAALAAPAALSSCSGDDEPEAVSFGLLLTPGQERDAWSRDPQPARVVVSARVPAPGGVGESTVTLADQAWPFDALATSGPPSGSYTVVSTEVYDATGAVVMRGETPPFLSDEGYGRELPLLVGRVGEFARPEAKVVGTWPAPRPVLLDGRYVLLTGGEGAGADGGAELFDLVRLAPLLWRGKLPRTPASVMTSDGANALLIDAQGASSYNFLSGTPGEVTMSAGDAAALAGGDSVLSDADAAEAFVVGATRPGAPSDKVLRVSKDGLTVVKLATPRSRASAAWVKGRGLVVVGGAEGAPVEVLAPKASTFKTLLVQAPATFEASLLPTPTAELLVVGGVDAAGAPTPPQRLPLGCAEACPAVAETLTLPTLRGGRAFDVGKAGTWLVVGADAEGFASAHLIDASTTPAGATPVAPRVRRRGGASLAVGGGYVAIVGGTDAAGLPVPDVELFTPPPP
ncbi:MAG TPA: hypothetical protein VFS43_07095 [Polyangiaceae bacterium]|nr:hypothetical protein [Polyangiaceae bacterium]